MNIVTEWFGSDFSKLHPQPQRLHTTGAKLTGKVNVQFGSGLAGIIGRRIAGKMGIPKYTEESFFSVNIQHSSDKLIWSRTFAEGHTMTSEFVPVGTRGEAGYWIEKTGITSIHLGVSIEQGNWLWIPYTASIFHIPIPSLLRPKVSAGKSIVNSQYHFEVSISLPILGFIFSYSGVLREQFTQNA
ncbi:hypothetical protein BTJ40_18640 [Microbulbifer sp. A4B17]|uniref:DUF4166 domain-containing protein n=1 Tax=Microbulbifer sp. A4B17 TaxID=359370 RepID=UPI000D52D2B7|nr:DUF4166 domain-containing protein [Microbulbifer sp. A4B17]AWF82665.1 hypothetical protein BTJ40_18640 [Microbulbifer sp. A4B17]